MSQLRHPLSSVFLRVLCGKGLGFPATRDSAITKAARRKIAAPQPVIVSERRIGAPGKRAFRLLG